MRVGPVWASTGGRRRRTSSAATVKGLLVLAVLAAMADMIASGWLWSVLGTSDASVPACDAHATVTA